MTTHAQTRYGRGGAGAVSPALPGGWSATIVGYWTGCTVERVRKQAAAAATNPEGYQQ